MDRKSSFHPWAVRSSGSTEMVLQARKNSRVYNGATMTDPKASKSNPIRDSTNRVRLGVFATNGNGAAFTFHPDRFKCTWDANVRLAQKAEKLGLEGFVSAAHWKSFGGDDHYSGDLAPLFSMARRISLLQLRRWRRCNSTVSLRRSGLWAIPS